GRIITSFFPGLIAVLFLLTAAHASGGGEAGSHEGPNWTNFFWRSVNFLALAGVCYWLMAKKVREFFTGRRAAIRTALAEAVTARDTAQRQFEEYSAKLDKATGEIDQLGEMIKSQGLAEKARIIDDARKAAQKIKEDTQTRMEQEFNAAVQRLRVEAVRLSTEMAEELLRKHIRATDHEAMVKEYIEKVVNKN
ncbi:MAG: ATP synthase F0 subunit B, partial [Proteobacteria bacterium]|nr:ATP synthase F0 subunit B [Pseudomonadota bacterium]